MFIQNVSEVKNMRIRTDPRIYEIHTSTYLFLLFLNSSQIELNYFTECLPYTAHTVTRTTRDHSDAIFLPHTASNTTRHADRSRREERGTVGGAIDRWMYVSRRSEDQFWSSWSTINTYITYLFFARPTQKKCGRPGCVTPKRAVNGINGKMPPPAGLHKKKTARGGDIPK